MSMSRLQVLPLLLALSCLGCEAANGDSRQAASGAGTERAERAGRAGGPEDVRAMAGEAYLGLVRSRVLPPEGSGIAGSRGSGSASAELQESGRLVVVGNLERDADAGFAADGRFTEGGWQSAGDGVELAIAPDGSIQGGGVSGGNRMTIEGQLTRRKLDVFFEIELTSESAGGFPAGTRFQFGYELWRPYEAVQGNGDDPCREVVYRSKLVPNLSGGPMGLVQVPECRP